MSPKCVPVGKCIPISWQVGAMPANTTWRGASTMGGWVGEGGGGGGGGGGGDKQNTLCNHYWLGSEVATKHSSVCVCVQSGLWKGMKGKLL